MEKGQVDYSATVMSLIGKEALKKYFEVSTWKGLFAIAQEWVLIIAAAYLCESYFHWSLYIIAVVFIGARYLALGLIMHEAVHGLVSKNKKLNEWVGELFCAWPLLVSMKSYRIKHLAHHKWLNSDDDPDYVAKTDDNWKYPMRLPKFLKVIMVQLSGLGIFETFKVMSGSKVKAKAGTKKKKTSLSYTIARLSFYVIIISLFVFFGKGMLLLKYWFIPFATWTQLINRLRRVAEHSGIEGKPLAFQTRTTTHGFIACLLMSPKNISYHVEHHLFPGVPCYNLREVHKELLKHEQLEDKIYISKNYVEVFHDCIKK